MGFALLRVVPLLLLAAFLPDASALGKTTVVTLDLWYPETNVPVNSIAQICGTQPFTWTSYQPLVRIETDHWQIQFTLDETLLNISQPFWAVQFKFLFSGQWELGANHQITAIYGLPSLNQTIYPYFFTGAGSEFTIPQVYSPQLNNSRDVWIYAPPAMVENPYFVAEHTIVMHDGQNLSPLWNVTGHLNNLIAEGMIEQIFVIGPYNTPDRIAEYTYSWTAEYGGGKGDIYLDWIEQTLLPTVQKKFAFRTDKLSMGGSSLGGLITCYAGITRPTVWHTMVCMSSSFWWNNGDFQATILPRLKPTQGLTQRYYVDSGDSGDTDDDMYDTTLVSTAFLSSKNNFILGRNFFWFMQRGGQHNEYWWSLRFHHPMEYLYGRPAVFNYNGPTS